MGKLDPEDSRAPYLQVADELYRSVVAGELAPGEPLPALHELAERFGVAVGTVRSALTVLRDKHVVVTRPGIRSFIREDLDLSDLAEVLPRRQSSSSGEVLRLLNEINERLISIEKRLPAE